MKIWLRITILFIKLMGLCIEYLSIVSIDLMNFPLLSQIGRAKQLRFLMINTLTWDFAEPLYSLSDIIMRGRIIMKKEKRVICKEQMNERTALLSIIIVRELIKKLQLYLLSSFHPCNLFCSISTRSWNPFSSEFKVKSQVFALFLH